MYAYLGAGAGHVVLEMGATDYTAVEMLNKYPI